MPPNISAGLCIRAGAALPQITMLCISGLYMMMLMVLPLSAISALSTLPDLCDRTAFSGPSNSLEMKMGVASITMRPSWPITGTYLPVSGSLIIFGPQVRMAG